MAKCRVRGCHRHASHFGYCHPHYKNGGKALRPRPMRSRIGVPRVLAWGRIYLRPDAVPVVEREARRLGLSKSGMLAEIVEAWAKARADATLSRRLTVCRIDGCERPVRARGLCAAHYQKASAGKPLKPAWERLDAPVKMGSLRLPAEVAARLKRDAVASGRPVTDLIRRALAVALEEASALTVARSRASTGTTRLGMLRLPADLAERLNVVAQELGVSVVEVVRRAMEFATRPDRAS